MPRDQPEPGQPAGDATGGPAGGPDGRAGQETQAAKTLGGSPRTLTRFEDGRRLTPTPAGAPEKHLLEGGGSAAATQRHRLGMLEDGLTQKHELTPPRDSFPWDWGDRCQEVRRRTELLDEVVVDRKMLNLRRFLTLPSACGGHRTA